MTTILKFKLVFAVVLAFVGSGLNLAQAAVPDTINYQGYLTNASDEPINTAQSITFKIYSVKTGGIRLWEQTKNVEVKGGKFSIELGDDADPFPNGLFDGRLFLGIKVGVDAEMSPRKPLTSAPFAINAGNAQTLEGETLSSIVYADADAVAAMETKQNANALNHDRYTNPEAVAAMGVKGESNALYHDRYKDPEAVAAIMAADGSGSTLDADLLDGQHAAEIIDAASDEVRTPISSVPFVISSPGSYYFTDNLTHTDTASNAITVVADNVTIDMMGFVLTGPGKGSGGKDGIEILSRANVTIMNGTVRNFGRNGIVENALEATGHVGHRIINVRVIDNNFRGIILQGFNFQVRGCTVQGNGSGGIWTDNGSIVTNNTSSRNGSNGIVGGTGSSIINNTAYNNLGNGISGGAGSSITNNTAYSNLGNGISGGTNSTLTSNTADNNQGNGIFVDAGSTLSKNVASHNDGAYGIWANAGSTLTNNTSFVNAGWGIYTHSNSLIEGNTVATNNASDTAGIGGIRVGRDSRVVGNTVNENKRSGIKVEGDDNIIESNHVTDTTGRGIEFTASNNAYRNNTMSGNTLNMFGHGEVGMANGGGNIQF